VRFEVSDERGRPTRRDEAGATSMAGGATPIVRESQRQRERMPPTRHPSRRLAASVYCEIDGLPVEIEPLELSTAGLFVETPSPHSVDSEVDVFLRIGDMRFESSGHVVQSVSCEQAAAKRRKPGYGLLFTNLNDAARAQLRHGIQSLVVQRASVSMPPTAATPTRPAAARPAANSARPGNNQSIKPAPERSPAPATSLRPKPAPERSPAPGVSFSPKPTPERSPAPGVSLSPKPPAIDPNEKLVLDRLRSELRDAEARTPWAVLGISQGADAAQAKKAFFDASKRYHPHLYARYATPEIKQVVTDLFIAHKRAYTTMLKTAQRMDPGSARKLNASKQPGPGNK
jgi:Tfp pilus assembly protein PilZ